MSSMEHVSQAYRDQRDLGKMAAQLTRCVLQDWVTALCTWKEQTVLLCAMRGTDANGSNQLKEWTRWIRRTVLRNAAPSKTFMQDTATRSFHDIAAREPLALDMLPVHYLSHLMHGLQVIAFRHPDMFVRNGALEAYKQLCEYLHVNPETDEQMTLRLKDEV